MTWIESWFHKPEPSVKVNPDALKSLEVIKVWTKQKLWNLKEQHLRDITYNQLSKLDLNQRLYFVTKNNLKFNNIHEWIKIIFDFGKNRELYNKTSAAFVIPSEVLAISAWGDIFRRERWKWEFFNKEWKRLIIWNSSDVDRKWYSVVEINRVKNHFSQEKINNNSKKNINFITEQKQIKDKKEYSILSNISDIDNIKNLKIGSNINFNFSWDKKLYMKISAGDIIPWNFNFVKTNDGKIWSRKNWKWEFFTKEGNRLSIWDSKFLWYSSLEIISEVEKSKASNYKDLLKLSLNYRLQNVSNRKWSSSNLKNKEKVTIDFSKWLDLYNSSLGEFMPVEVRSIKWPDWKIYSRLENNELWEFLDDNMNRLRVKNWDLIEVYKIETSDKVKDNIKKHNNKIKSLEYRLKVHESIMKMVKKYNMPKKFLLALLKWENQNLDYLLKVKWRDNTAFGLLQMVNKTWYEYGKWLDRNSILWQLESWLRYLTYIKKLVDKKNNKEWVKMSLDETWLEVITLYHTWPFILKIKPEDVVKKIAKNLKWNPWIRGIIAKTRWVKIKEVTAENVTPEDYLYGAKKYYKRQLV